MSQSVAISVTSDGGLRCDCSRDSSWCDHIKKFVQLGHDASLIQPGMTVIVPVFPSSSIWTEVEISANALPNGSAMAEMIYQPDIGRPLRVQLGFWNPGEGRNALRSVILDKLQSEVDPREELDNPKILTKCPASIHSYAQQVQIDKNTSIEWKWACIWNMVMEKACTPCMEISSVPDNGLGGVTNTPPWSH